MTGNLGRQAKRCAGKGHWSRVIAGVLAGVGFQGNEIAAAEDI